MDGNDVMFSTSSFELTPFYPDGQRQYTLGADHSILLTDRPMWITVDQDHASGRITVEMNDGKTEGQKVFVSASWLETRGIDRPRFTHEDGSPLAFNETVSPRGYLVDMHHFSFMEIDPEELEVKGRQAGVVADHPGEIRWYALEGRLLINVSSKLLDYEVLIPKDWIDGHIPRPVVGNHTWTNETLSSGITYYVVALTPVETPTILSIHEKPWEQYTFSWNMTDFNARVAQNQSVTFPTGASSNVTLKMVRHGSPFNTTSSLPNGTLGNKTQFSVLVPSPEDRLNGTNGTIIASDHGFAGFMCIPPYRFSYGSEVDVPTDPLIQNLYYVAWRELQEGECSEGDSGGGGGGGGNPNPYPYDPPVPTKTRKVTPQVHMEQAWRETFTSSVEYLNHAVAAIAHANPMWERYTGNRFLEGEWPDAPNIPVDDEGSGTYCSHLRRGFERYLDDEGWKGGDKAYILISGNINMTEDCLGVGRIVRDPETGDPVPGVLAIPPSSVNYGFNHNGPYRGRTSTEHFGKLIAQEVGHNWGEPTHPCEEVNGERSIMASSVCNIDWDGRKFWLHYDDPAKPGAATDSSQRIIDGTEEYDHRDV